MTNPETDPIEDEDDLALLHWLDGVSEGSISQDLPAELLEKYQQLPRLLDCIRLLNSMSPVSGPTLGFEAPTVQTVGFPRPFGPYELEQELGRGGMGVVYLARHQLLGAKFALKVIRTSEFASPDELRRFRQEGRTAAQVRHPHVVSVHDAGEFEGTPYLVMQYIQGASLSERLRQRRARSEETLKWMLPVAHAVQALHGHGIVHRDLKPGNILLDREGMPHVTDFGLAKLFEMDGERTASGTLIGTPAYMSPEQAWGDQKNVGPRSDVYSLGAILYELLTGQPPFAETNPLDQILRLRDSDPRPPRFLDPNVHPELEQICMRCLEKRPRDRYQSAGELAADFERLRRGEPIALRPIGWWNSFRRWVRRESPLASHLAGFITMALIVQVADWMVPGHRAPYVPVMSVLATWTVVCILLQKLLLRGFDLVKLIWVALDALLFTIAVAYAEGPTGSLMVGYSLMIVASAMWYDEIPVILMTVASVVAYIALLAIHWEPQPAHYPFIVVGILAVVGGVVTALVRRIRQLVRIYSQQ